MPVFCTVLLTGKCLCNGARLCPGAFYRGTSRESPAECSMDASAWDLQAFSAAAYASTCTSPVHARMHACTHACCMPCRLGNGWIQPICNGWIQPICIPVPVLTPVSMHCQSGPLLSNNTPALMEKRTFVSDASAYAPAAHATWR